MKTIIAGTRTATAKDVASALDKCPWSDKITVVISGCFAMGYKFVGKPELEKE